MQYAQSLVLQQLLSTDALTGIANRRRFDAALAREWRRMARVRMPLSLLMIDVDHFKAFNDHCGHQRGDECLRQVARILVNAVGRPGDLVARYGGEEFVCLLPAIDEAGARAVAERLLRAVRGAAIAHPRSPLGPRLTISIGVATTAEFAGSPDALVALADRLLYAAKDAGRDRFIERRARAAARAASGAGRGGGAGRLVQRSKRQAGVTSRPEIIPGAGLVERGEVLGASASSAGAFRIS